MGPVRLVLAGTACLAALGTVRADGAAVPGCPPELAVPLLHRYGPTARADVDGDGARDSVWIAAQPSAPAVCGIFLAVRTARGLSVKRLPGDPALPAQSLLRHGLPRLFGLLRLGRDGRLEPVVIVARATNAVSFALYTLADGRLRAISVAGSAASRLEWADGALSFESVDCAGAGDALRVRSAFATRRPDHGWLLTRRTYRLTGSRLALEDARSANVRAKPRLPGALPFAHCSGLRAGG